MVLGFIMDEKMRKYAIIWIKTKLFPSDTQIQEIQVKQEMIFKEFNLLSNVRVYRTTGWADIVLIIETKDFPSILRLLHIIQTQSIIKKTFSDLKPLEYRINYGRSFFKIPDGNIFNDNNNILLSYFKVTPTRPFKGQTSYEKAMNEIHQMINNQFGDEVRLTLESIGWEDFILITDGSDCRKKILRINSLVSELNSKSYTAVGLGLTDREQPNPIKAIVSFKLKHQYTVKQLRKELRDDLKNDISKKNEKKWKYSSVYGWFDGKIIIPEINLGQMGFVIQQVRKKTVDTFTEFLIDDIVEDNT